MMVLKSSFRCRRGITLPLIRHLSGNSQSDAPSSSATGQPPKQRRQAKRVKSTILKSATAGVDALEKVTSVTSLSVEQLRLAGTFRSVLMTATVHLPPADERPPPPPAARQMHSLDFNALALGSDRPLGHRPFSLEYYCELVQMVNVVLPSSDCYVLDSRLFSGRGRLDHRKVAKAVAANQLFFTALASSRLALNPQCHICLFRDTALYRPFGLVVEGEVVKTGGYVKKFLSVFQKETTTSAERPWKGSTLTPAALASMVEPRGELHEKYDGFVDRNENGFHELFALTLLQAIGAGLEVLRLRGFD